MKYAEVLAPLPLDNTFTYIIPEAMQDVVRPYCTVVASFGKNRFFTGLIVEIHDKKPEQSYEIKELTALLDVKPAARASQLTLWKWISSYYMCSTGDVYKAALPSGLMADSKTLKLSYKPKTATYIRTAFNTDKAVNEAFTLLKGAKQQERLLNCFLEQTGGDLDKSVLKSSLLEYSGASAAILNGLLKRGILVAEERNVSRILSPENYQTSLNILTDIQQKAYNDIRHSFENKNITLLHGVASSGKTEIYIRLIADILSAGKQALYLLPEMAITTQITERLRRAFGNRLIVYHSGYSDNERAEVWNYLLETEDPVVVLGMRSAVFLPFARLGLVVVDEEQEPSYKQQDPAPRYHARNVAMMLAQQHGAKTLLGSAAPSLESYLWAVQGKYGFVKLDSRYGEGALPRIEIADVRDLKYKRRMKDTLFSPLLREMMTNALSCGEQVILFQNRRGFAPFVACRNCGETPHCVNCDVSLTWHKQLNRLVCHYCGYTIPLQSACSKCGSLDMQMQGFGTEKIEEEVAALFPGVAIARLDMDSAHTKNDYSRILSDFASGKTQVLIGTQMITKGLDFAGVSVVGILNADVMINIPDFRAYERAFQMMLQVSGRAGRRTGKGFVVLQTSQADNQLLQFVKNLDYRGMAEMQLQERHTFHYPPYNRLIVIILRCAEENILDRLACLYSEKLRKRLSEGVSDPVSPPVTRVKALFVRRIMLKIDYSLTVAAMRNILAEVHSEMQQEKGFRKIILHYDVDPQ